MRTLALAYLVTFTVYATMALGVALFMGAWGPVFVTAGVTATAMCGFDYYTRWATYKRQLRQIEAKKAFLRSMGIDVDALMADQAKAKAAPVVVAPGTN